MHLIFLVGIGSMLGAVCRYCITVLCREYKSHIHLFHKNLRVPFGTILVNTLGCFIIGALSQITFSAPNQEMFQAAIITGYLGGLTTYSAFGMEAYNLIGQRRYFTMLVYILTQLVLGMFFIWLGIIVVGGLS